MEIDRWAYLGWLEGDERATFGDSRLSVIASQREAILL